MRIFGFEAIVGVTTFLGILLGVVLELAGRCPSFCEQEEAVIL